MTSRVPQTIISLICSNSSRCRKAVNSSPGAVWLPRRSIALNLISSCGSILLKVWRSEESFNSAGLLGSNHRWLVCILPRKCYCLFPIIILPGFSNIITSVSFLHPFDSGFHLHTGDTAIPIVVNLINNLPQLVLTLLQNEQIKGFGFLLAPEGLRVVLKLWLSLGSQQTAPRAYCIPWSWLTVSGKSAPVPAAAPGSRQGYHTPW